MRSPGPEASFLITDPLIRCIHRNACKNTGEGAGGCLLGMGKKASEAEGPS